MIQRMIDSNIGQIMERINEIHGTSLRSFQTPILETLPNKETVRSQLFNYSVVIYGYYEGDYLVGLIYYQLPAIISFQKSATIYWTSCEGMSKEVFSTFLAESVKELFIKERINKIKIHLSKANYYEDDIESELIELGFSKEAEIKHGVGWENNLLVFSRLNEQL